jgi:hypothetical protein
MCDASDCAIGSVLGKRDVMNLNVIQYAICMLDDSSSISQKITWQKDWVHLTSERSLQVKNVQKRKSVSNVKT